ncbi:MAG: hypothetical protein ACKOOC_11125, partial [Cyanobium sp.]
MSSLTGTRGHGDQTVGRCCPSAPASPCRRAASGGGHKWRRLAPDRRLGQGHPLPSGPRLWQTLTHKSACLSCAWGTGGQNGGFRDELGEPLQSCLKSVEAISAELQPAVPAEVFAGRSLTELQQLSSADCDRLGRLDRPLILRSGSSHYTPISWEEVHALTAGAFR